MAANPFFVSPLGGQGKQISQGLQGLGEQFKVEQEQEKQALRQAEGVKALKEAYASQNPDLVAQAMFQYPEMKEQLASAIGFRNKATKNNMVTSARAVLANPEKAEEILNARIAMVEAQGGDASQSRAELEKYRQDPEGFIRNTEMAFAGIAPDEYKAYIQSTSPKQDLTTSQKEYAAAVKQGFQGTFMDYKKALRPEGTKVTVGATESEEQKAVGKARGQAYSDMQKSGVSARKQLTTLNTLDKLSDDALSGTMAGARAAILKLGKTFGVDFGGVPETEAFNALSSSLTLEKAGQLSGALSDKDIAFLQSTVPQLNQSKEGRRKLIAIMKEVANIELDMAKEAAKYRRERGTFDQLGFEEYIEEKRGGEDMLAKFFEGTASADTSSNVEDLVNKYAD